MAGIDIPKRKVKLRLELMVDKDVDYDEVATFVLEALQSHGGGGHPSDSMFFFPEEAGDLRVIGRGKIWTPEGST